MVSFASLKKHITSIFNVFALVETLRQISQKNHNCIFLFEFEFLSSDCPVLFKHCHAKKRISIYFRRRLREDAGGK